MANELEELEKNLCEQYGKTTGGEFFKELLNLSYKVGNDVEDVKRLASLMGNSPTLSPEAHFKELLSFLVDYIEDIREKKGTEVARQYLKNPLDLMEKYVKMSKEEQTIFLVTIISYQGIRTRL